MPGEALPEAGAPLRLPVSLYLDGFNTPVAVLDVTLQNSLKLVRQKAIAQCPFLSSSKWRFLNRKRELVYDDVEATSPVRCAIVPTLASGRSNRGDDVNVDDENFNSFVSVVEPTNVMSTLRRPVDAAMFDGFTKLVDRADRTWWCEGAIIIASALPDVPLVGAWSEDLSGAVWSRDPSRVASVLGRVSEEALHARDRMGLTALHEAAMAGAVEVAGVLADRGARASAQDGAGRTPLYYAAVRHQVALLELLLARCADAEEARAIKDVRGDTLRTIATRESQTCPALWAALEGKVEASPDQTATYLAARGNIFDAALNGEVALVDAWLTSPQQPAEWSKMLAAKRDKPRELQPWEMWHSPTKHWSDVRDEHEAAAVRRASLMEELAKRPPKALTWLTVRCAGRTVLHEAVEGGHTDVVRLLCERGANPARADPWGQTACHFAARRNNAEALEIMLRGRSDVALFRDATGATALHHAARFGAVDAASVLLRAAPEAVSYADRGGATPCHVAASSGRGPCLALLLDAPTAHSAPVPYVRPPRARQLPSLLPPTKQFPVDRVGQDPLPESPWRPSCGSDAKLDEAIASFGTYRELKDVPALRKRLSIVSLSPETLPSVVAILMVCRSILERHGEPADALKEQAEILIARSNKQTDHHSRWRDMNKLGQKAGRVIGALARSCARAAPQKPVSLLKCAVLSNSGPTVAVAVNKGVRDADPVAMLELALDLESPGVISALAASFPGDAKLPSPLLNRFWRQQVACAIAGNPPPTCALHSAVDEEDNTLVVAACAIKGLTPEALAWAVAASGASGQYAKPDPATGESPLACAAAHGSRAVIEALLAAGWDPCARDSKQLSPLCHAATNVNMEAATVLVARGACRAEGTGEPDQPASAVVCASRCTASEALSKRRLRRDEWERAPKGKQPEQAPPWTLEAQVKSRLEMLKLLLTNGAPAGSEALAAALVSHNADAVRLLCSHGAKPSDAVGISVEKYEETGAAWRHMVWEEFDIKSRSLPDGSTQRLVLPLLFAVIHKDNDLVRALVECGASVAAVLPVGCTVDENMWQPPALAKYVLQKDTYIPAAVRPDIKMLETLREQGGSICHFSEGDCFREKAPDAHMPKPSGRNALERLVELIEADPVGTGEVAFLCGIAPWDADYPTTAAAKRTPNFSKKANEDLPHAVFRSNVELAQSCLARGADPNLRHEAYGDATALTVACRQDCPEIVRALIRYGADLAPPKNEVEDAEEALPLLDACLRGSLECATAILDGARDRNLPPDHLQALVATADVDGCTPLMGAARSGNAALVALLLDRGASIDAEDGAGCRALAHAVSMGHEQVSLLLLERGSNPTTGRPALSDSTRHPLLFSAWWHMKSPALVTALIARGVSVLETVAHAPKEESDTDFAEAPAEGDDGLEKTVEPAQFAAVVSNALRDVSKDRLLAAMRDDGECELLLALTLAAHRGDSVGVSTLLSGGVKNVRANYGELLQVVASNVGASPKGAMAAVDYGDQRTILHLAAQRGLLGAVTVCAECRTLLPGGSLDTCDKDGLTALHLAAAFSGSDTRAQSDAVAAAMVRVLCGAGADCVATPTDRRAVVAVVILGPETRHVRSTGGQTPLHSAARANNGAAVTALLEGLPSEQVTSALTLSDERKWMRETNEISREVRSAGHTPLVAGALRGCLEAVKAIAAVGMRRCASALQQQVPNALRESALAGHADVVAWLLGGSVIPPPAPLVPFLVHDACRSRSVETVRAVLEAPGYAEQAPARNEHGHDAIDMCHAAGAVACAALPQLARAARTPGPVWQPDPPEDDVPVDPMQDTARGLFAMLMAENERALAESGKIRSPSLPLAFPFTTTYRTAYCGCSKAANFPPPKVVPVDWKPSDNEKDDASRALIRLLLRCGLRACDQVPRATFMMNPPLRNLFQQEADGPTSLFDLAVRAGDPILLRAVVETGVDAFDCAKALAALALSGALHSPCAVVLAERVDGNDTRSMYLLITVMMVAAMTNAVPVIVALKLRGVSPFATERHLDHWLTGANERNESTFDKRGSAITTAINDATEGEKLFMLARNRVLDVVLESLAGSGAGAGAPPLAMLACFDTLRDNPCATALARACDPNTSSMRHLRVIWAIANRQQAGDVLAALAAAGISALTFNTPEDVAVDQKHSAGDQALRKQARTICDRALDRTLSPAQKAFRRMEQRCWARSARTVDAFEWRIGGYATPYEGAIAMGHLEAVEAILGDDAAPSIPVLVPEGMWLRMSAVLKAAINCSTTFDLLWARQRHIQLGGYPQWHRVGEQRRYLCQHYQGHALTYSNEGQCILKLKDPCADLYGPVIIGPNGVTDDSGVRFIPADSRIAAALLVNDWVSLLGDGSLQGLLRAALAELRTELCEQYEFADSFRIEVDLSALSLPDAAVAVAMLSSSLLGGRFVRAVAKMACDDIGGRVLQSIACYRVVVASQGDPSAALEAVGRERVVVDRAVLLPPCEDGSRPHNSLPVGEASACLETCELAPVLEAAMDAPRAIDFIASNSLPVEILLQKIFNRLLPNQLIAAAQCSKSWHAIAMDAHLWDFALWPARFPEPISDFVRWTHHDKFLRDLAATEDQWVDVSSDMTNIFDVIVNAAKEHLAFCASNALASTGKPDDTFKWTDKMAKKVNELAKKAISLLATTDVAPRQNLFVSYYNPIPPGLCNLNITRRDLELAVGHTITPRFRPFVFTDEDVAAADAEDALPTRRERVIRKKREITSKEATREGYGVFMQRRRAAEVWTMESDMLNERENRAQTHTMWAHQSPGHGRRRWVTRKPYDMDHN